jgi:hypothetical protein
MTSTKTDKSEIDLAGVEVGEKMFVPRPDLASGSSAQSALADQNKRSAIRQPPRKVDFVLPGNIYLFPFDFNRFYEGGHPSAGFCVIEAPKHSPTVAARSLDRERASAVPNGLLSVRRIKRIGDFDGNRKRSFTICRERPPRLRKADYSTAKAFTVMASLEGHAQSGFKQGQSECNATTNRGFGYGGLLLRCTAPLSY